MRISRREFIKLSAVGFGSAILTACGIKVVPTDSPTASPVIPATSTLTAPSPAVATASGTKTSSTPASNNPDFIAAEILGCPTDTSAIFNIVPAVGMTIYYEYGKATGTYTDQTSIQSASAGEPIETVLSELEPNTRYIYRLHYNDSTGVEHSFVTQRKPGSTFTFDIQGDSHPERINKEFSPELYPITLQQAALDQPDFYMTIGDDFSVDTLKTINADAVEALYINQRQWLGQVGVPVFLVNGNHEQAAMANLDGTPNNVAVYAQNARNSYFPQPAPDKFYSGDNDPVQFIGQLRDYYAFTWGDALFVVLDQYWHSPVTVDNQFGANHEQKKQRDLWQVSIGDTQYKWFKQTLENSTAKYKFVFSHHVLGTQRGGIEIADKYEWGDAGNLSKHRLGWDKTIHQLMTDNHVTIYFQGHDHIFVRQELDGVIYQTLPEPADPNYAVNNADSFRSGDKFPNTGYLRVVVSPANVSVNYVRSYLPQDEKAGQKTGDVAFTYSVQG